jgi:hypothetical protein
MAPWHHGIRTVGTLRRYLQLELSSSFPLLALALVLALALLALQLIHPIKLSSSLSSLLLSHHDRFIPVFVQSV